MLDSERPQVLAVDGGGTRCRFAVLIHGAPQVVETGPANAFSDFEGAVASVLDGLRALAETSGLSENVVRALPAFVGLAGVTSPATADRLAAALPLTCAQYGDDRRTALSGALGDRDGVVAHCGTGSFMAARIDGETRLAGGWGALLGDEASALWVGRRALAAALRSVDGFEPETSLLSALLAQYQGTAGVLDFANTASINAVAALAPQVTQAAEAGDTAAQAILQAGAQYIADGAAHLGWAPGRALCLTGGIGPVYAPYLPAPLRAALAPPHGTPLDGAIALALTHAKAQTGPERAHGHR